MGKRGETLYKGNHGRSPAEIKLAKQYSLHDCCGGERDNQIWKDRVVCGKELTCPECVTVRDKLLREVIDCHIRRVLG
jgi:hypothetical protein